MREFWFNDSRTLAKVAAIIAAEFGVEFVDDAENRYEWCEGSSEVEGLNFNLCRAHVEHRMSRSNPVRVSITGPSYSEAMVAVLGTRLANCLGLRVAFGNVTYLGGDEFRFEAHHSYSPAC